jgi:hypothetical protein
MSRISPDRIATGIALALLAVSLVFAQEETGGSSSGPPGSGDGSVARVYRIDHLDTHDAALRAQQICLEQPGQRECEYRFKGKNWFTFFTDPDTQTKIEAEMGRIDVPAPSLNFRIALLLAQGESGSDPKLPAGEQRALQDLKQFLPYKGYRLLDAGWIRSQRRANLRLGSDPAFQMSMHINRDFTGPGTEIRVERFELQVMKVINNDESSIQTQNLIGSSFTMQVGETVVVGTSKLNGDNEALIVLLTATE